MKFCGILLFGLLAACTTGATSAGPDSTVGATSDAGPTPPGAADGGVGTTSGPDAGPITGSGTSGNGALSILKLTATTLTLTDNPLNTETSQTQFVAIVTDTAGLDTIAGGTLEDDTGTVYGAFSAGANKGTYVASVSYSDANALKAINFPMGGGSRTFVARFFDNAKNEVTAQLGLSLKCRLRDFANRPIVFGAACDGTCHDLTTEDYNCGSCGNSCRALNAPGESYVCSTGLCKINEVCSPVSSRIPAGGTCEQFCQTQGLKCDESLVHTYESKDCSANYKYSDCVTPFAKGPTMQSFRCYCD